MEITLEKIELVKDRTGVSYKEAKEALELSEGSVVDAIIAIEEAATATGKSKASEYAQEMVAKIKEFVNKGNISKIAIKRGDDVLLNIPVSVGIVGIALAPWGALAAAIAAFGFKCDIELTQDDGKVINITEKTLDATEVIREKGAVVWEQAKDKGSVVWEQAKDKGVDVWEQAKDKGVDTLCSCGGYGMIVDDAADKRDEGMSIDELYEWVMSRRLNYHHEFFNADLSYFKRTGRMSGPTATIASVLDIVPSMHLNSEGRIIAYGKVRGLKKELKHIVDEMKAHAENGTDYSGKCFINHARNEETALVLRDMIAETFPNITDLRVLKIGSIITAHCGPGTISMYYYGDERIDD